MDKTNGANGVRKLQYTVHYQVYFLASGLKNMTDMSEAFGNSKNRLAYSQYCTRTRVQYSTVLECRVLSF
jgi:hypothetical protein